MRGSLALPLEFKEGSLLEDSELNSFFAQVVGPVIQSNAKVRSARVHLIKAQDFNAFAVAEPEIFIFSRVIEQGSLGVVVGILLHELGHIAGHHVMQSEDAFRTEKWRHSLLPVLIGTAMGGPMGALAGLSYGSMSSFSKMMCHSRRHEYAADAFSIDSLQRMGWPIQALEETMKILSDKTAGLSVPAYFRTHPYTSERLQAVRAKGYKKTGAFPQSMKDAFQRIKAKTVAYCAPLDAAQGRIDRLKVDKVYKKYGNAIVAYRKGLFDKALGCLSDFESASGGQNAYTNELRSDILLDKGDKRGALLCIQKSLTHRPRDLFFMLKKCYILFIMNQYKHCSKELEAFFQKGHSFPFFWDLLGRVLYKQNKKGPGYVCQAEQCLLLGDKKGAKHWVDQASPYFDRGGKDFYALRFVEVKKQVNGGFK